MIPRLGTEISPCGGFVTDVQQEQQELGIPGVRYLKAKVSFTDVLGEVGSAGKHNYKEGPKERRADGTSI